MNLWICDDDEGKLQEVREIIDQEFGSQIFSTIRAYTPYEVMIDVEEGIFDCDILILDVVYKTLDFTGIDLARKVNDSFPFCRIIYLTNNLEYAPLVYETNHCYLVLQSDMHTTLRPAIMKAIDIHKHDLKADALEVKSGGHRNFINRKDILYIERENRKIKIVTESRSYSCYLSLKELLSKLGDNMIRTHGGYAVNMEYITFFGKDYIELKSEIKIPVGRTYEADARRAYLDFWSQSK